MNNGEYNSPVVQVDRGIKSRRNQKSRRVSKYSVEGKDDPDLDCDHHDTIAGANKKRSM